jgi:hypothetical protein
MVLNFSLPVPQLLFLVGLAVAFLGLIGARGTIREITFDLSPLVNRVGAVIFGLVLLALGTQYGLFFPGDGGATPTPIVAGAVATPAPTSVPMLAPTAAATLVPTAAPTAAPALATNFECTVQGNFNVRESPGNTFKTLGNPLKKGDKVTVLGWSDPVDGSSTQPWFKVVTADGRTGWTINSAMGPNNTRVDYPLCNFKPEAPPFPFGKLPAQ